MNTEQQDELAAALRNVIQVSDEFVQETGLKHGDPLTDAVDNARAVLDRVTRARNTPKFRVVIDTLTDGSQVAAVIFHCDYDMDTLVQIDCADQAGAQNLCDLLNSESVDVLVTT